MFWGFTLVRWNSSTGFKTDSSMTFPLYAEQGAQLFGDKICVDGHKERRGNLLCFRGYRPQLSLCVTGSAIFPVKEIEVLEIRN
jgi:hypothetical protein